MLTVGVNQAAAQIGACCLGDGDCIETNQAGCDASSGEFLGVGSTCAGAVCDGACCVVDDSCTEGSADDCAPGDYQGAGSTCATHCAGPLGTGFTWQGQLRHSGAPLTGMIDLEALLWTAAVGGDQVGATLAFDGIGGNPPPIEVVNGLFTVRLDFGADAFDGDARFLEIAVRSPHDPGDAEPFTTLSPRQPLTATPYALQTRGIYVDEELEVGIGTLAPNYPLHVESNDPSFSSAALYSHHTVTSGTHYGVYGQSSSTAGRGVFGWATATSGTTHGVWGQSASTAGFGVYGRANATSGFTYGVRGQSDSTGGHGVFGWATAASGTTYGVQGHTSSTSGRGAYGRASATSGTNYGVWGQSNSTSGFDFYAAGAGTNYGSASSIRWKHNVEPIDRPLEKIARLRGVTYDWDAEHGGHHDVGMIAEEVGQVLPEIVQYEENGADAIGMDYSKLTPLLVEAVKELSVKLEQRDAAMSALRAEKDAEFGALRTENAALAARVARIEKMLANDMQYSHAKADSK